MNKLTADTARSLLARMKENESNVGLTIRDGYMMQALEIALPVLYQPGGWISCSERMPEDGQRVLCWLQAVGTRKPTYTILTYKAEKQSERHSHFPPIRDDLISHWQPLPAPPPTTPQIDNDGREG